MTQSADLDAVAASTVYDRDGEKVGKVVQLYIDDHSQLPTWAAVKTGWFGAASLVPLAGAHHTGDRLEVTVGKDAIKAAPHLDADAGISQAQGEELLRHYGLTTETAGWDTYGRHASGPGHQAHPDVTSTSGTSDTSGEATQGDVDASVVRSEERLNVGTERVTAGTARLRKYVVTEDQTVTVPVTREEVEIVREPIRDGAITNATIGEDDAEITVHQDKVVVDKETVPVERVGLAVNEVTEKQTVSDTVRKEQIDTQGTTTEKPNK